MFHPQSINLNIWSVSSLNIRYVDILCWLDPDFVNICLKLQKNMDFNGVELTTSVGFNGYPTSVEAVIRLQVCYCWLWGFFSCSGVPKILQSTFTLPLALVCVPSSPAKTTKFKITLDTNQAPVQLSSIFSGNAHQYTADTLQGDRPVRALVARFNTSQKLADSVKRQKCWGRKRHIRTLMWVFETIFKIQPQN